MAQTVVRSFRLPAEMLSWLDERAKSAGTSANAIVLSAIEALRQPPPRAPKPKPATYGTPRPDISFGYTRPKPGALLIEKKRK